MDRIYRWFFENQEEKNGRVLPFSRADVFAGAVLSLAMMVAIVMLSEFSNHPGQWNRRYVLQFLGAIAVGSAILLFARKKRVILVGALGILALRLTIGFFLVSHSVSMFAGMVGCWMMVWFLGKEL